MVCSTKKIPNYKKIIRNGDDIIELLDLKNDYTFKRVFGFKGNEEITKELLNTILEEEITKVTLDCDKILERDLYSDKLGVLDIKAKLNENIDCDIEMQIADYENIEKRILYYLSKMYISNLKKSEDYRELHKCVAIVFINFELDKLKDIPKYITKWNIREEKYTHIILTDAIEIYIIEMPKVERYARNSKLDTWVKFITKLGEVDMENAYEEIEGIKKAKKVLEEISADEHERYLAHLREKYVLDMNSMKSEGFDQGAKQEQVKIAKKMKEDNVEVSIIEKYTGLSKEEIEKL